MSEAKEPTAVSPKAPKPDRFAKARAAKADKSDRVSRLEAQIKELKELVTSQSRAAGATGVGSDILAEYRPGEYYVGGVDASTGRQVMRKRRYTKTDVEKLYPPVTFAPIISVPVRPHGITYELRGSEIVTVPSIVKDIHDAMVFSIRRQSEGYRVSDEQSKRVFDAAKGDPGKGRHFTGLEHIGYGWSVEALQMVAKGRGNDAKAMEEIGWESEIGFPGGYDGKPLAEAR